MHIVVATPTVTLKLTRTSHWSTNHHLVTTRAASFAVLETRSPGHDSSSRSRRRIDRFQVADSGDDGLPLLLAIDRVGRTTRQDSFANDDNGNGEHRTADDDSESEIDEPFAVALAVWRGAQAPAYCPVDYRSWCGLGASPPVRVDLRNSSP